MAGTKKSQKARVAEAKLQREMDKMPRCNYVKKNGHKCKRAAGEGTDHTGSGHCKTCQDKYLESGQANQIAQAGDEVKGMAQAVAITPGQALAGVLHLSAGQLTYATQKVAELEEDEIISEVGLNAWIRLQRSLMHDLAKFAKIAADAGIDERMASLAEEQTRLMAKVIEEVAGDLNLTKEQKQILGPALRRRMQLVQGGA